MRRLSQLATLAAAAAVAACASTTEPLIDHRNVSDAKYNGDLAACKQSGSGLFSFSNPVKSCMERKGYKVLM